MVLSTYISIIIICFKHVNRLSFVAWFFGFLGQGVDWNQFSYQYFGRATLSSPLPEINLWTNINICFFVYQQVFDILPLYSTLHPHETQKIQFTFYGHANISSQAVARCSVYGGPDYDIELLGQASLVQYFFDRQLVDYGKQVRPTADSVIAKEWDFLKFWLSSPGKCEKFFFNLRVYILYQWPVLMTVVCKCGISLFQAFR